MHSSTPFSDPGPFPTFSAFSTPNVSLQEQRLEALRALAYPEFEALMRRMFSRCGFATIRSLGSGRSRKAWGEGGFDLLAIQSGQLSAHLVGIQLKQLSHNVGRRHVDELRGALLRWRIEGGLIVTTSWFGSKCREAEGFATLPAVQLIDGQALLQLLEDTGLLGEREIIPVGFESSYRGKEPLSDAAHQDGEDDLSWEEDKDERHLEAGLARSSRAARRENRKVRRRQRHAQKAAWEE